MCNLFFELCDLRKFFSNVDYGNVYIMQDVYQYAFDISCFNIGQFFFFFFFLRHSKSWNRFDMHINTGSRRFKVFKNTKLIGMLWLNSFNFKTMFSKKNDQLVFLYLLNVKMPFVINHIYFLANICKPFFDSFHIDINCIKK